MKNYLLPTITLIMSFFSLLSIRVKPEITEVLIACSVFVSFLTYIKTKENSWLIVGTVWAIDLIIWL